LEKLWTYDKVGTSAKKQIEIEPERMCDDEARGCRRKPHVHDVQYLAKFHTMDEKEETGVSTGREAHRIRCEYL
jgi:hypothetical protein